MTYERSSRSSASPPPLSRASTPDSSSTPSTPVFRSSFPHTAKMSPSKAQVGFASPLATSSCRIADWDELFVMRRFAAHAEHCFNCRNPEETRRNDQALCRTGTELVKDIGQYFYCRGSKPYSTIDRKRRGERVQVEIPADCAVVKTLFDALSKGLRFASLKEKRPEIHHSQSVPAPATAEKESYEVKVNRSGSRRQRSNTIAGCDPVPTYVTRSPDDPMYRESPEPETKSRGSRRTHKRGSLYIPEERQSKRKSTYILPFSSGWLN